MVLNLQSIILLFWRLKDIAPKKAIALVLWLLVRVKMGCIPCHFRNTMTLSGIFHFFHILFHYVLFCHLGTHKNNELQLIERKWFSCISRYIKRFSKSYTVSQCTICMVMSAIPHSIEIVLSIFHPSCSFHTFQFPELQSAGFGNLQFSFNMNAFAPFFAFFGITFIPNWSYVIKT